VIVTLRELNESLSGKVPVLSLASRYLAGLRWARRLRDCAFEHPYDQMEPLRFDTGAVFNASSRDLQLTEAHPRDSIVTVFIFAAGAERMLKSDIAGPTRSRL